MKTYHMYRARVRAFRTHRDAWQGENSDIIGRRLMVKAQDITLRKGRDKGSHGQSKRFIEHPERVLNHTLSNHPWHEGKYADG